MRAPSFDAVGRDQIGTSAGAGCGGDRGRHCFPPPPAFRQTGRMSRRNFQITPELMLRAYRAGLFPMAETRGGERLYWLDPEQRGILPLHGFHVPRRLMRTVLAEPFEIASDRDFGGVIAGCAARVPGRDDTWINPEIERLFTQLHRLGHAHS